MFTRIGPLIPEKKLEKVWKTLWEEFLNQISKRIMESSKFLNILVCVVFSKVPTASLLVDSVLVLLKSRRTKLEAQESGKKPTIREGLCTFLNI